MVRLLVGKRLLRCRSSASIYQMSPDARSDERAWRRWPRFRRASRADPRRSNAQPCSRASRSSSFRPAALGADEEGRRGCRVAAVAGSASASKRIFVPSRLTISSNVCRLFDDRDDRRGPTASPPRRRSSASAPPCRDSAPARISTRSVTSGMIDRTPSSVAFCRTSSNLSRLMMAMARWMRRRALRDRAPRAAICNPRLCTSPRTTRRVR